MTFQGTKGARWLRAIMLASVAVGAAACAEDEPAPSQVGSAYEALATQLQNCASNALDCYGAASCDEAAEQACREDFRACREATREAYRAYHASVRGCFRAKLECVYGAWSDGGAVTAAPADGGTDALGACRDEFRACVEVDRPIPAEPGPCMSGLRECVQSNVQWGEDGSQSALRDCLSDAHSCITSRLPMCEPTAEDASVPDAANL